MKRILSVSYDEALLRTRAMLLQHDGHSVMSALGFTDAVKQCKEGNYDLFILGSRMIFRHSNRSDLLLWWHPRLICAEV